ILHHFLVLATGDAFSPYSGLSRANDGRLYATTWDSQGEAAHAGGTVFAVHPSGTYTKLHTFTGTVGAGPYDGVIQASDGYFYGTTTRGGTNLKGSVFKMDALGTPTQFYAFTDEGGYNAFKSGLIQATDGSLYGTTYGGGASNFGTIY